MKRSLSSGCPEQEPNVIIPKSSKRWTIGRIAGSTIGKTRSGESPTWNNKSRSASYPLAKHSIEIVLAPLQLTNRIMKGYEYGSVFNLENPTSHKRIFS